MDIGDKIKRPKHDKHKKKKKKSKHSHQDNDDHDSIVAPIAEILSSVDDHAALSPVAIEEAQEAVEHAVEKMIWPPEDIQMLIDNISKFLPKHDVIKYSTTIKKINWDDVKFKDYTAEQCKSQWDLVMSRIRRYRTLTDIMEDAKSWVKNPYINLGGTKKIRHPDLPKKPLTPFLRYFIEKQAKYAKKNADSKSVVDTAKALAAQYKSLSEKRKDKYKAAFDREYQEYRQKLEQFKRDHPEVDLGPPSRRERSQNYAGPVKPKTPFQLYFQEKSKKQLEEGVSKKDSLEFLRKAWHELPDGKRIKWIKRSVADEERYNQECEEYKKSHPEFEPAQIKVLNKAEKELKQRCDGKPERPPTSGYALYSKMMLKEIKDCPAKEKMAQIAKRWNELSQEEKNAYSKESWESSLQYAEQLETYLQSLPQEERDKFMAEEKVKLPSIEKLKSLLSKEGTSKNKPKSSLSPEELVKDVSINSAAQCYYQAERLPTLQQKYPKKTHAELAGMIISEWSKLPLAKKEPYLKQAEENVPTSSSKKKPSSNVSVKVDPADQMIYQALKKKIPKSPPRSAYLVFQAEKSAQLIGYEPRKRMAEVGRLWRSVLSKGEKDQYEEKLKRIQNDYAKELQAFLKSLDKKEREVYEKYFAKSESSPPSKKVKKDDGKSAPKVEENVEEIEEQEGEDEESQDSSADSEDSSEAEDDSDDENKAPTSSSKSAKRKAEESDDEEEEDSENDSDNS